MKMWVWVVLTTCPFFVAPALRANIDRSDAGHVLTNGGGVSNFSGTGTYYNRLADERGEYAVSLQITPLSAAEMHLRWDYTTDGEQEIYSIVVAMDNELLTIYTPPDKDSLDNLDSYEVAGWGYSGIVTDSGQSKLLVFLNYKYIDGNRYDEHFAVQRAADGELVIDSSGTLGNSEDGMIEVWQDQVRSVD